MCFCTVQGFQHFKLHSPLSSLANVINWLTAINRCLLHNGCALRSASCAHWAPYLLLLCMFSMFSKISMCKWSNVSFNLSFNIAVNMCNDKWLHTHVTDRHTWASLKLIIDLFKTQDVVCLVMGFAALINYLSPPLPWLSVTATSFSVHSLCMDCTNVCVSQ